MDLTAQIAKQLRAVYFGGNWTVSSLKEHLDGVNWEQATTPVNAFNTIATLVYHMGYYVTVMITKLQDGRLDGSDKHSFTHPPIQSQEDWEKMLGRIWAEAETLAGLIEQIPESKLWEDFYDNKYGNYYRNLHGIIEHFHYHLGQIVLIKKMLPAG